MAGLHLAALDCPPGQAGTGENAHAVPKDGSPTTMTPALACPGCSMPGLPGFECTLGSAATWQVMSDPFAAILLLVHPSRIAFSDLLRTKGGDLPNQRLWERLIVWKLYRVLAGFELCQLFFERLHSRACWREVEM